MIKKDHRSRFQPYLDWFRFGASAVAEKLAAANWFASCCQRSGSKSPGSSPRSSPGAPGCGCCRTRRSSRRCPVSAPCTRPCDPDSTSGRGTASRSTDRAGPRSRPCAPGPPAEPGPRRVRGPTASRRQLFSAWKLTVGTLDGLQVVYPPPPAVGFQLTQN